MPGGTSSSRSSDHAHHCKMGLVVTEPRTTTGGLTPTLAQLSLCKAPRDLHLPDQLTDSESCVALCRQCRPYLLVPLPLLKQGQEGRYFTVLGDMAIRLTLTKPGSTHSREGVR